MSNDINTQDQKRKTFFTFFVIFIIVSLVLVYMTAFTKYIWAKDYFFIVETTCDPEVSTCFVRDCEDYCPPNGLEIYSSYLMKAYDFEKCPNGDCYEICTDTTTSNLCEKIECDLEIDSCTNQ